MKIIVTTIALTLLACAASPALAQKLYKWVDADGNVHYSDSVPPEDVDKPHEQFNEQGIVVDRVERAKTAEEIAAEEAARKAAEEEARRIERQRQEDAKLLAIYSSEADITRARDQQVDAIERAVDAARAFVNGQSKSLAVLMERAASAQDRGQEISEALASSIDSAQSQIREQEDFIAEKEAEKQAAIKYFEGMLARFREIKARHQAMAEAEDPAG